MMKKNTLFIFFLLLISGNVVGQTVWTYDFGTTCSTCTYASNGNSTTFISNASSTPLNGGTYRVRRGNAGGGFTLANPGTTLGTGNELQIQAPTSAAATKFGVYSWASPSTTFYLKAKVRTTSSGNGALTIGVGTNTFPSDNQNLNNSINTLLTSLTINYASGAISSVTRRTSGSDNTVAAVSSTNFAKDTNQEIEIYANNANTGTTYTRSGSNSLSAQSWDLWIDGVKMSPSGGWAKAGNLAADTDIAGFIFNAESSTSNAAYFYIDDLEYSNGLPTAPTTDHTITVTQGTGGTITPGTSGVDSGDNISFTATPDSCHNFSHWVVDASNAGNTNPYEFTNVTANHAITAIYTKKNYTITSSAGANGTISPNGATSVDCGANQSYVITADSGYAVDDVLVDGVSVGAVTSYAFNNVTVNHTIEASFKVYTGPWEDFETGTKGSYASGNVTCTAGEWTMSDALIGTSGSDKKNGTASARIQSSGYIQTNFNITTGLGDVTVNHANYGSDAGGKWRLKISTYDGSNWSAWTNVGNEITSTSTLTSVSIPVNVAGTVKLRIEKTGGNRINIDDIYITPYSGSSTPKINIQGNGNTITDGDTTPSTTDGTDFGATIIAGTEVERTFTIQNLGSADLTLDDPAIALLDGSKGFSVSAQPTTNPMAGFTNQTFKIKFSNTTPGTYTETVMIGSDDPDTPVYSFDVKAVVLQPLITVSETSLTGFTYSEGQPLPSTTQSFVVNGSNLEEDITVTASSNWEISTNLTYDGTNVSPWSTITLLKNASNGVTNRTIHVRLKAGLPEGTYTGTVTLTSLNAETKTVTLSGEVTPAIPVMGITGAGSSIANGSTIPYGYNNTQFASQNLGESQVKTYVIKNSGGAPLTIGEITIYGTGVSAFAVQNAPELGTIVNPNGTIEFKIKFAPTTIGLKTATVSIENNDLNKNPFTFAIEGGATYCSSTGEIVIARQDFEVTPATPTMGYSTSTFGTASSPGPNTGFSTGTSGNSNSKPTNNNLFSEEARGYRIQGSDEEGKTTSGVIFTFDGVDTSNHTGINLSFKVAGFSLGTNTNGMDHLGILGGGENDGVSHDQKIDFVLVEVSPDNGVTWYQQAKVVSNELNLAWSFGSTGTISGARDYVADNNLTYFGSTSAQQYSAIAINNLPQVSQLKVRITAQNNSDKESWILDDIQITSTGLIPKTWDGTQWLPSVPIKSDKAIINEDYNSGVHGSFKVCQCEIKSEKKLTVAANHEITVTDFMINNGEIIVENDANFLQTNEEGSNSGVGTITVKRESKMKRLDYTYWSSPVANQQLKAFSPNTQQARFYEYHENDDLFYTTSWLNDFVPAKGYAIRAFNNYSPATAEFTFLGEFKGTPNNGPKNFPLSYTPTTLPDNPTHVEPGYNLTGNPYPSNIDFDHLVDSNIDSSTNKSLIYKNAWFWTNTNLNLSGNLGSAYNGDNYAIYTGSGGLAAPHTYSSGQFGTSQTPTRYIKVGQGFMIKARALTSHGKNLVFSNSVRTSQDAGFFPKKGNASEEVDRFWLRLITPANNVYSLLVAYIEGATNDFEGDYDAKRMGTPSDDFYTVLNNEKYAIQGRQYPLEITDVVALGNKFFETGQYSIGIEKKEGIFDNGQNIYLKDKETGILTNLSQGIYTFTASKGESTGRFEIVYQSATLSTNTQQKDDLHVYRDGNNFVIKSGHKKITGLEVYDSSGRLVYTTKSNSTEVILHSEKLNNGMYILKINRGEEVTSKKIIR